MKTIIAAAAIAAVVAWQDAAPPRAECGDWVDCRTRALDAADRKDYEALHDFAWRAVQKGPANDPSLLLLVARAQSLSGRPHDALVMLRRLAPTGVAREALTSEDFERVRSLPGWPEVEAAITGVRLKGDTTPEVRLKPDAAPAMTGVVSGFSRTERGGDETLTFDAGTVVPASLAYDKVSRRFIVADSDISRLAVIDEFSGHLATLATGALAGFGTVTAIEIDPRLGNLWVASVDGEKALLHQLQLISARTLKTFPVPAPVRRITDLSMHADGSLFAASNAPAHVLALRRGASALEVVAVVTHVDIASIDATPSGVYLAVPDLIQRLGSGTLKGKADLGGVARLRWSNGSLIALQSAGKQLYRLIRIRVTRDGQTVTGVDVLDPEVRTSHPALTIVEGVAYYLVQGGGSHVAIRKRPL